MINIVSKGDELLETRLNEATNPLNLTLNIAATEAFCEQVLNEPEGAQVAVRLLAHKVQSPQEKEALYSFAVIDECVKKCGPRFHQEVGKFRFLNELIKVISPKYLALHTSPAVKKRCIECLYSLYKGIPHEVKLTEAYNMLKKQRIITSDPSYIDDKIFKVTATGTERTKSIFESSKDAERLTKLLKSRNPDDLREANRIIKTVVQADNNRIEQLSKRQTELETMRNNIQLLGEMLLQYVPGESNQDDSSIMKEVVDNLEKSRSEMFKLSRETDDDECLNDIIKVIDECNTIIKKYWDKVGRGHVDNEGSGGGGGGHQRPETNLICQDLLGDSLECDLLSNDLHNMGIHDLNTSHIMSTTAPVVTAPSTKYDELMDLFPSQNSQDLITPINGHMNQNHNPSTMNNRDTVTTPTKTTSRDTKMPNLTPNRTARTEYKGFEDLDILSKEMFNLNKKKDGDSLKSNQSVDVELLSSLEDKLPKNHSSNDLPLLFSDLGCVGARNDTSAVLSLPEPGVQNMTKTSAAAAAAAASEDTGRKNEDPNIDLSNFSVPLTDIKPHPLKLPITIYNNSESKVKITLYFANDRPHPDISVLVAQISTESNKPVTDIVLKFAVSKPNRIRKLNGQTNCLAAHSPFTPSTPINEVVLLYKPSSNDKVDLKYQLSYELNGESFLESANTGPMDL